MTAELTTRAPVRPIVRLPGELTPALLEHAAGPIGVVVEQDALEKIAVCREFALRRSREDQPIYGIHTGFGPMVAFAGREDSAAQGENILAHLGAGQGPDLDPALVRATMLARLWSLSRGLSGVSVAVIDRLVAALGTGFAPAIPRLGSVGASGDLIPLSYLARALGGDGFAYLDGERMPASMALEIAGLTPWEPDARDGLGLVNGISLTAAAAGLAVAGLTRSHRVALTLSALLTDVLGSEPVFASAELLRAFGHAGGERVAAQLRMLLDGTEPTGTRPLQEPYSVRCVPQLAGAVATSLDQAAEVVLADLNGVSDNPLFFPERDEVVHGGNFFGQPSAFAADLLAMAATQLGNLAERQLDLLVDPHRNGGLPPMLATEPGRQHGVQGVQLAATATVVHMRRSTVPGSVQSVPTNGHNQDVVPFGTQAAFTARDLAGSLRWLHGSLGVALRQAVHVGGRRPTAPLCADALDALADAVPPIDPDRPLDGDVRRAADVLDTFVEAVSW